MKEFENIGKNMPYTVPEGFFQGNVAAIDAKIKGAGIKAKRVRTLIAIASTAALAASLAIVAMIFRPTHVAYDEYYASLSNSELSSWVSFCDNDLFINQTED